MNEMKTAEEGRPTFENVTFCSKADGRSGNSDTEEKTELKQKTASLHDEEKMHDTLSMPLSKNQLKKLRKRQFWESVKHEKRQQEREKRKRRRKQNREEGIPLPPSKKALQKNTMARSACRVHVAVDCSFDEYMQHKDVVRLVMQLARCYSMNRRSQNPMQYHVVASGLQTQSVLDTRKDFVVWDVNMHRCALREALGTRQIVYLSSESPNVVTELQPDVVYVIGGLVDHNHHKGLCHRLAEDAGLDHAQLPIADYLHMKTRKVLTIDQVFGILLHWTECRDWLKAFMHVLPQRKGAAPKEHSFNADDSEITDASNLDKQKIFSNEGSIENPTSPQKDETLEEKNVKTVINSENAAVDSNTGVPLKNNSSDYSVAEQPSSNDVTE